MGEDEIAARIEARRTALGRPITVGISGYGGSGKSTLTRALIEKLVGAVRMRGDDFLDPVRSHRRSTDWDGVERTRLVAEVLLPFRERRPSTFRRYDWDAGSLAAPEHLPEGEVLVVDLIGLFHPDALHALDLTVWCDVEIEVARERGMRRDARRGRDHRRLWDDVWIPNEIDFAARFQPREAAELLA